MLIFFLNNAMCTPFCLDSGEQTFISFLTVFVGKYEQHKNVVGSNNLWMDLWNRRRHLLNIRYSYDFFFIQISLKFVFKGQVWNKPPLIQVMIWVNLRYNSGYLTLKQLRITNRYHMHAYTK